MRIRKSVFFKILILAGIIGFLWFSGQSSTNPIQSEQVQIPSSTAAINQTNTIPANGEYLFQHISSNLTAGLRDDASLGRVFEGGNLAINKSGTLFENYSLLPAGSYDDCYDSFSNDPIGQVPDGYTIIGGTGGYVEVSNSYLGHSKVLKITATQNTAELTAVRFPASSTSGNFSCWICVDKTYIEAYSYCPIFASTVTNFAIMNGYFQYWPGTGGWTNTWVGAGINYWYYIRVSFTPSQLKWYVNEVLVATVTPAGSVSNFELGVTPNLGTPYTTYYDAIDVDYDGTYDLRNTKDMSTIGVYNGSDSFENETAFAVPKKWSDLSGSGCRPYVVPRMHDSADGHKNVLCVDDNSGTNIAQTNTTISSLGTGWIEFWARTTDTTKGTGYHVQQGPFVAESCNVYFYYGNLNAWDGVFGGGITLCSATNNVWYHIRIFQNITSKTFDVYVDGLLRGSNINFSTTSWSGMANSFIVTTETTHTGYLSWIDALDTSSTPGYYANRSTYNLLQQNVTFSTLGSYAFQYTLNSSGVNYPGDWTSFSVEIPKASVPQSLVATNATNRVDLTWTPPAWGGYGAITNYTIYRGTASGVETLFTVLGNVTSYSDTSATSRTTPYFYKVSANNSFGEGDISEEVYGDPILVPEAPGNLVVIAGNRSINLTWTAPVETGGSWITNYTLYRRTFLEPVCTFLIAFSNTTFTYNDTGLTNGDAYYYQISANNSAGEGSKTSEVYEIPRTIPGSPQNLLVTATGIGWVYLTWEAPASTGGSPIIEYWVYRGTTSGGEVYVANVNTLRYCNDTDVTNGVKYYYYVTAVNVVGEGNISNERWGIPTFKLQVQAVANPTGIQLSWNTLSYISVYAIYQFTSASEDYILWSPIATTGQVSYFDALDTGKTLFYYQVVGYNAEGDLVVVSDPVPVIYDPPTMIDPIFFLIPGIAVAVVVGAYLVHRARHSMPKLSHHGL